MNRFACLLPALLVMACSQVVEESFDPTDPPEDGATTDGVSFRGTPCRYLTGEQVLPSWNGDQSDEVYPRSLFSFELATSDFDKVRNDGDVLYVDNMFMVNTVTDDRSFIVDLGDVALESVPYTVDPEDFPTGNWDEHDALGVILDHTYLIRTIDGNTNQWAALRVVGLAPSESVTFAWIRSTTPDGLRIPTSCL